MAKLFNCEIVGWLLATAVAAQQPQRGTSGDHAAGGVVAKATLEQAQQALSHWLEVAWSDDEERARVVSLLLDSAGGLEWFGAQLRGLATDEKRGEKKARESGELAARDHLRQLATHVVLTFVRRGHDSGVVFRGQYAALSTLQPMAGEILLRFLLDGPGWFDMGQREWLVPALRDLMPRPPSVAQLLGVVEIVESVRTEPEELRLRLACLLWQWDRREFVDQRMAALRAEATQGDAEDRTLAYRRMADLYYRIAEYDRARKTHDVLLRMAETGDLRITPTDWYWSACYRTLSGKTDEAFVALGKCAELLRSRYVDRSIKLPRALFETDPELSLLREDPRFAKIMERAFPVSGEDR